MVIVDVEATFLLQQIAVMACLELNDSHVSSLDVRCLIDQPVGSIADIHSNLVLLNHRSLQLICLHLYYNYFK